MLPNPKLITLTPQAELRWCPRRQLHGRAAVSAERVAESVRQREARTGRDGQQVGLQHAQHQDLLEPRAEEGEGPEEGGRPPNTPLSTINSRC
ncbi:hypothetical protein CEXT_106111 [Caerostris extrusa]|uniref:Uncharacterized protein n=1 Tax=Caerostris extrusa TaxID=172846 RepID=A0AAV4QLX4_CAEEX|nr:hypothetical protein CEXT_106111 [Caerostris extrusa]